MPTTMNAELVKAAVWIRPAGPALQRLEGLVEDLHHLFGGPRPRPHVTLVGGLAVPRPAIPERLTLLAGRIAPLAITLGRLAGRDDYFRCFYACVEPTPELVAAHRWAVEIFGVANPAPFEPHVSLLYGDMEAPTRLQLARDLGGRLDLTFQAGSLHFVDASDAVPVEEWRSLEEYRLRAATSGRLAEPAAV